MIGAFSRAASSTTSSCSPAHPAPHIKATFFEEFRISTSLATSDASGITFGIFGVSHAGTTALVCFRATSPGMTTTATPFLPTATLIARARICGSWSGFDTSST